MTNTSALHVPHRAEYIHELQEKAKSQDLSMEYAVVTGSHSWGLATPESDIDYRGVYGKPLSDILSVHPGKEVWRGMDGIHDWQMYEIRKTLHMLQSNNGNVVQMFHNPMVIYCSDCGFGMRRLARQCLTKQLAKYYHGYATSQRQRAMRNRGGKSLVYTIREMYCGIHLMLTHDIVFDFGKLRTVAEENYCPKSATLDWALERRHDPMPLDVEEAFDAEWVVLQDILRDAVASSSLPERLPPDFSDQCDKLLIGYRMHGHLTRFNIT